MPSVETILQQGQVCVVFARANAASYSREDYDAKAADADAKTVEALEKQLNAKQGATSEVTAASGEVGARIADLRALLERVWRRVELAESRLPVEQKDLFGPAFKLRRKGRKLGAVKLARQAVALAGLLAKSKLATPAEKLGRLPKALTAQLLAEGNALTADTRARGRKKGERMTAVDASVARQQAVERYLTAFKRLSGVVFEEAQDKLDELHQKLRAVEQPVRRRKPTSGTAAKGKKPAKTGNGPDAPRTASA